MSERVKVLAERERRLQERCAAQRVYIAAEVAAIEERLGAVDRMARATRSVLLHPAVIAGGIVALLTIGKFRGMRFIGRLYLLSTAARRLIHVVRALPRSSVETRREERL